MGAWCSGIGVVCGGLGLRRLEMRRVEEEGGGGRGERERDCERHSMGIAGAFTIDGNGIVISALKERSKRCLNRGG